MTIRVGVRHEVQDECGILYNVEITASGSLTAVIRVCGSVIINGESYSYDKDIRVKLKKDKDK